MSHTPGAIRAAEAITGGRYGELQRYKTPWGSKTVKGIADIIDAETAAPELLAALGRAVDHLIMSGIRCDDAPDALRQARAAIAKAEGR